MEHKITIEKTARVHVLEPEGEVRANVLALHGYGQLALYFSRKFDSFTDEGIRVIVPEGFHRFYLEGHSGRVGASWMTKEDRLQDISDYEKYLDQVVSQFVPEGEKLVVFAFSQGVATGCRWVSYTSQEIIGLITWAGTFPPDVEWKMHAEKLNRLKFLSFFGDNDPFIPLDKAKGLILELESQGVHPTQTTYRGAHDFQSQTVLTVIKEMVC
jgi:predicted esterase